jgi:ATP-dependent Lon protease
MEQFIQQKKEEINPIIMNRLIESFTLKDLLVYGKNDIYKKYITLVKDVQFVKTSRVDAIIKYFTDMDIIHQRKMIINLLIYNQDLEIQYIAYMLYDLISTSGTDNADSLEQKIIYDSFPWKIKMFFKEAMKNTIQYSQENLNKNDMSRVSIEQQIVLMRADNSIKDRALSKLKEVKGKPDDQGNKAKQYLEGLLKIPFGVYKEEPVLKIVNQINKDFSNYISTHSLTVPKKKKYTVFEINKYLINESEVIQSDMRQFMKSYIQKLNKNDLLNIVKYIESVSNKNITKPSSNKSSLLDFIEKIIEDSTEDSKINIFKKAIETSGNMNKESPMQRHEIIEQIRSNLKNVNNSMDSVVKILDDSIYGHNYAKNQILKIVAQWINGEQSGYCFGFEGSPGVGKTSLAKRGLAKCLQDENGISRPFSFVALGGSCNGSTLEGHNYTYVNAQWGKIVDILMETKCMNPIIYIDELDKVSKTEQGKEIIGILTHMIDYTQNDEFQDKYFSGIPIDLSKTLFIFSYNDPDQIDRVLLDRIHRIKFDNLSSDDKNVIVNDFILPDINRKMGFDNVVNMPKETVEYIVEFYTMEPGIRKLKEILFDLYGEINIELLRNDINKNINLPITVSVEDLGKRYLKKYSRIHEKLIHSVPKRGVINGLWANALGKGGIIPIEVSFFPSSTFLELRLTGLQGDVMKESMNVAKTLAWSLTPDDKKCELMDKFEKTKNQGLHINCPEGAVSKDGPSAGAAITLSIYSLFNSILINNEIAITGEINLQGNITAIGGLELKIMGGIRAGVKKFIYPKENKRDFDECLSKYKDFFDNRKISFQEVSEIKDAFQHVYL